MTPDTLQSGLPMLSATGRWEFVLEGDAKAALERLLPDALKTQRWFGGKGRTITSAQVIEAVPIPYQSALAEILLIKVHYADGAPETYVFPLTCAFGSQAYQMLNESSQTVIARLHVQAEGKQREGVLYDALWDQAFSRTLVDAIRIGQSYQGTTGQIAASPTDAYCTLRGSNSQLHASVLKAEQSNTSVAFEDRLMLKLYRRLGDGINPDLEIGRALTAMKFPHVPPLGGAIEYRSSGREPVTLGILQGFVQNQGDAWSQALDAVRAYYRRVLKERPNPSEARRSSQPLLASAEAEFPELARKLLGAYLQSAERLGQRTAELHVALAQCQDASHFTPEPFSPSYRQSRYDSMCRLAEQNLAQLRESLAGLPEPVAQQARRVLDQKENMLSRFRAFLNLETTALRARCHGDFHLGQVLCAGDDFTIIDFEGEPARPLTERRAKHSPLLDVAGMVRSFHYAPHAVLYDRSTGLKEQGDASEANLSTWAEFWFQWVSAAFLKYYVSIASAASLWPRSQEEVHVLLDAHLLEKAVYELGYELNNRPTWLRIPLQGILQLMEDPH